jgi:chitinase
MIGASEEAKIAFKEYIKECVREIFAEEQERIEREILFKIKHTQREQIDGYRLKGFKKDLEEHSKYSPYFKTVENGYDEVRKQIFFQGSRINEMETKVFELLVDKVNLG